MGEKSGYGIIKGEPLIKFKDRKIIESLQSGKIYLNTLKWFRDYENEEGDTVVGDSYEGMLYINEGELIIKDTRESIKLDKTLLKTVESNAFVYCMTYINPCMGIFEFSEAQKKEFKKFGDTALLILDSEEFINRIRTESKNQGYDIYFDSVKYYDENIDSGNYWFSLFNGTHNVAFWKKKSYSEQQEFRMVIPEKCCNKDYIVLEIGDISDISKIFSTEQLLKAKFVKQN